MHVLQIGWKQQAADGTKFAAKFIGITILSAESNGEKCRECGDFYSLSLFGIFFQNSHFKLQLEISGKFCERGHHYECKWQHNVTIDKEKEHSQREREKEQDQNRKETKYRTGCIIA